MDEPYIKLDQFLKWCGAVGTGGEAKKIILDQLVQVNGQIEIRRGRKLRLGDRVQWGEQCWEVDPNQR